MHQVLSGYIERKEMPGLVALVSRHDDVHVETLGSMFVGHSAPMKRDTIFRIASITKPIAAVAAMILVEECRMRLDESIEPWLPELANRRVLNSISSQLDDTVPALRAITVRDLLTFRMGFGSVMAPPDTHPIQKLIREYRIGGDGPMLPSQAARNGRMAAEARLAAVDGATGRALAVPGERRCARRPGGAGVGAIPRHVHAPAHLRSVGNERHRIPRAFRQNRAPPWVLFPQSSDQHAGCV